MKTMAVINQKGGVGKTTTAVNLGHALARTGRRVMVVDLDPQGHLSPCLGLFRALPQGVDRVLLGEDTLGEHAISTRELMELVPAGNGLGEVERLQGGTERGRLLRQAIDRQPPDVDYLIFDCPPSAGLLVMNALFAVDQALIPVAGDFLSLTGLARLMGTLGRVEALRQRPLERSIFLSRYVARRRLSREVREKILEHFPDHLMETFISEAAVLAECAGAGRTIFEYRARSRSAAEFEALAGELIFKGEHGYAQEASHVA
ncbi:MAG: ParA family protein [Gammaproteobacteria bacterium]|nr:MAG: ParA family protein [Gammaproteobacteria bacterium]